MDADQVLAFRLGRSGLARREARGLAEAAACPASDFARGSALLALAARAEDVSAETYDAAADSGDVVVAHVIRGAIHALAPADWALYGRALLPRDDEELAALDEVAAATSDALKGGRRLDKVALHEELRARVGDELLPWCRGCKSHHVAPMLWRYATVKAGVRLDAERRYLKGRPGRAPAASEAVRRFLHFYGPSTVNEFAAWARLPKPQARRLWDDVAGELAEVKVGRADAWALRRDTGALESPPAAAGVRLLPPGDPYLQRPDRALLAPDPELRKRLFRPVASPGAVLKDGRLAGLWRAKAKGRKVEITVEKLGRLARGDVEDEAARVAALRGSAEAVVVLG